MELRNIVLIILVFALGVVSTSLIYEVGKITSESPLAVVSNPAASLADTLTAAATNSAVEKSSPADHVKESQIKVTNSKVELDIQNAVWSRYTPTHSMDPVFDSTANGIEVIPKNVTDVNVGDIVSYQSNDGVIVHRVISIGNDDKGTYFVMKGDNNPVQDPEKVRFEQIKGVLVGIIY